MKSDMPVYPMPACEDPDGITVFAQSGITARDHVAILAMSSMLQKAGAECAYADYREIAKRAYMMADAMIVAQG